ERKFGPSLWGHERRWMSDEKREEARLLCIEAAENGQRQPVQVIDGNYNRMAGVCPWWDQMKATKAVSCRRRCHARACPGHPRLHRLGPRKTWMAATSAAMTWRRIIAMKAGVASPNGVVIQDVPDPKPKPTDLLVKIKAIALNRADLGSARGDTSHGAAAGRPVGSEFSGEVVEVGGEVHDFKVGDRVMCHSPGSHAEYAVSDSGRAMKVPDGMGFEQAATLPIGLNTLHNALITAGRMKAGEAVMVQGASSGVGIIGLQIAKLMGAK